MSNPHVSAPFVHRTEHTLLFGTTCEGCEGPFADFAECVLVGSAGHTRQWHRACYDDLKKRTETPVREFEDWDATRRELGLDGGG